jgi:mono/diheme cytochrome c family protein
MNAFGLALAITLVPTLSAASDPRAQRGRTFAQANCALCHAVNPVGDSPLRMAPPVERYPVDTLAEALAEDIVTLTGRRSTI